MLLPPQSRAQFLEQACGADTELRQGVEALMLGRDPSEDSTLTAPKIAKPFRSLLEAAAGDEIGPYKLLKKLGEGGMGTVWRAQQNQPVRRQVALKLVRQDLDSVQVLARFEAERQALALMDHPNIARVLEVGATVNRRPYFVMELVEGKPITRFCDDYHLSVRERLELFVPVCQAVQHAHQKGVIHRDLKPSNVLVARYDDKPVPKVIDFGVAKATGQQLTEHTLVTQVGAIIGTLEYMSPEQAELNQVDIDTRSDVYSLGVLLYELLTGSTPLTREVLRERAFDKILRRIREEEPPKPSTRLGQSKERLPAISDHRKLAPKQLTSLLRGDLDWIVMRALEKDRTRRYETANELAMDLLRYLHDEPVLARPPSNLYRLSKLARRHRLAFASAAAVALSLLIGMAVSTGLFLSERQAHKRAGTATKFLTDMLNGLDPSVAQGDTAATLKKVLDKTADRVGTDLRNDPETQADLRDTIGRVYFALGLYDKAQAIQRAAIQARQSAVGSENPEMAAELGLLANTLGAQNEMEEAERLHRQALALRKKLRGKEHRDIAESLNDLSLLLFDKGSLREAELLQRQALAMSRKLGGDECPEVASSLNNLAEILVGRGKLSEAEQLHREELSLSSRRLGTNDPDIAVSLNNLARLLSVEGKLPEAEDVARQALALRRRVLPKLHPHLAESLSTLGCVLTDETNLTDAEPALEEALAMRRALSGTNDVNVALSLQNLAEVFDRQGRLAEAEKLLREALAIREKKAPDDPWTFNTRSKLGGVLAAEKKFNEAEPLLLSGYEGIQQRESPAPAGERPALENPLKRLIQLYQALGQPEKATPWLQRLAELNQVDSSAPGTRVPTNRK